MESSRDITAVSSNNGGDDITEETSVEAQSSPIRSRIACNTGHILNDLTASVWYSYALLYFQNVVALSPLNAGVLFFISQLFTAAGLLVVGLGYDKRLWRSFSVYGRRKARHILGSAGVLFAWPLAFAPCLFCKADSSNTGVTAYYLLPVAIFSICWPLAEVSYSSLMLEIEARADKDLRNSRSSFVRVCNVCLYILLWVLLQHSSEENINHNTSKEFTRFAIVLLPLGFLFVFVFHLTVPEPRSQEISSEGKQNEEKYSRRSSTSTSSPNQESRRKMTWYDWLREPLLYQIGLVCVFTNNVIRILQVYLPIYLIETLQLRKESVAFFPLIIVISRIVTEITCKNVVTRIKPRVVVLCTTCAIFGTCMWFFLQTNSRSSLVYAPTVVFACMSSLLTMVTPKLHQRLTGNDKECVNFVSGLLEFLERMSLGGIVLLVQLFYPDSKDRSIGDYMRVAFPAAFGTIIVIPLLVATAFLSSKNSEEGPQLTITVPSPLQENDSMNRSIPLTHCIDLQGSSATSTPPVDMEQSERRRNSDCAELQGSSLPSTAAPSDVEPDETRTRCLRHQGSSLPSTAAPSDVEPDETRTRCLRHQGSSLPSTAAPSDVEPDETRTRCLRHQGSSLSSTAVPSDVEPDETRTHSQRDRAIEEVKKALDELHRLPSTDL